MAGSDRTKPAHRSVFLRLVILQHNARANWRALPLRASELSASLGAMTASRASD